MYECSLLHFLKPERVFLGALFFMFFAHPYQKLLLSFGKGGIFFAKQLNSFAHRITCFCLCFRVR